MELSFEIELRSDYHIGSGYGVGTEIDSALFRESDGVPSIRGSVLTGLMRQGLRELLKHPALTHHAKCKDAKGISTAEELGASRYCGDATCAVCRIFGSPQRAKHWRIGSARPLEVSTMRRDRLRGTIPSAQVVQRTSIEPRKRLSEAGKLFTSECGSNAIAFTFNASCEELGQAQEDAALLVAAARMVRQLGRSRKRGLGECLIRLRDDSGQDNELQQQYLEHFRQGWLENKVPSSAPSTFGLQWQARQTETSPALRWRLLLKTEEPVLITDGQQAGNQITGLDYIPGTTLMGAFAARAAQRWDLNNTTSDAYKAFVNMFRRGALRFPTLYPALLIPGQQLQATIPAPTDLLTCPLYSRFDERIEPGEAHPAVGPLANTEADQQIPESCTRHSGAIVSLDCVSGYLSLDNRPKAHRVRMREEIHVRIDPATQTAAAGNLYSYFAIDAGQYFIGDLEFRSETVLSEFLQLTGLKDETLSLRLGRAMRRGYGGVQIALEKLDEAESSIHIGQSLAERIPKLNKPIVMTFLTDTILTDGWGRYRHCVDEDWLSRELLAGIASTPKLLSQFTSVRSIDGFFSHLGRPRHREIAIKAGSAVGFVCGNLDEEQAEQVLAQLALCERQGLGYRRGEGFGAVAFNHPIYDHSQLHGPRVSVPAALSLDDSLLCELDALNEFETEWGEVLDKNVAAKDYEDQRWRAAAQWVRSQAAGGISQIKIQLNQVKTGKQDIACLGTPSHLFLASYAVLRERNWFAGKVDDLLNVLEELERRVQEYGPAMELQGLNMLAERIAAMAKIDKTEDVD